MKIAGFVVLIVLAAGCAGPRAGLLLPDGSTASMVRLWVRKGATALKIEAFHVQDTAAGLSGFTVE